MSAAQSAGDGGLGGACNADGLHKVLDVVVRVRNPLPARLEAVFRVIQHAIDIANKLTLGTIPWLGQVRDACKKAADKVGEVLDRIRAAMQGLAAPWFIKCVGEKIQQGMVPRVSDFATSLDPNQLACKKSWKGDAADAFFVVADKQKEAADECKGGVQKLADAMVSLGNQGMVATVAFVLATVKLVIEIAVAIAAMAAVPVGTAIGAADIIKCVLMFVALLAAFLAFVMGAAAQAQSFTAAVREVPMGGTWPPAVA